MMTSDSALQMAAALGERDFSSLCEICGLLIIDLAL